MNPLVSILIPAYNAERWIADTIESALAQTWPRKEIIVVDDGSGDGTLGIARRYESTTVRVITQRNGGGAAARNTAFALCQGDYVQWLDADDLLVPDKVASQMHVVQQYADPQLLLSGPWAYFMYRPSRARFSPTPLWDQLDPIEWTIRKWTHNLHMQTATWLVSRELSAAAGPWNTQLLGDDDGEYFARVVLRSRGVRFVPEARVFYRVVGAGRLSHIGVSTEKLDAHFKSMQLQIALIRSIEDSPRVRAAVLKYLETWLPLFFPERRDIVAQMEALAAEAGGTLAAPRTSPKYALIKAVFGGVAAKRVQLNYNIGKTRFLRSWDKMLYELQGK